MTISFMKYSLRVGISLSLMAFGVGAQTAQKPLPGSVTGRIKIGGNSAPGVSVALTAADVRGSGEQTSARAVTDASGLYILDNLAAGRYRVTVIAPGYVVSGAASTLQLGEGQSLGSVDFALTKGSVITGRVTVNGDRAVIGEPVTLTPVDESGQPVQTPVPSANNFRTDDRGVYRIYGVAAGKYWVSVGRGENSRGGGGPGGGNSSAASRALQRTYYPDAVDSAQASIVEVEAEKEVGGIDIRMGIRETYAISGRAVDAETGKPVAGILIGHGATVSRGNGRSREAASGTTGISTGNGSNRSVVTGSTTDGTTGVEGEFRIEGISRGSYAVFVTQDQTAGQSEFYSDPVAVEVSSQDVGDVEIKVQRAVSVSGLVIVEGANNSQAITNLSNIVISAQSRGARSRGSGITMMTNVSSRVEATGGFRIAGLASGLVNLSVRDLNSPGPFSGLTILRIERNGADVQSGLRAESGEQVTGIRVVLAYGSSVVRGVVKVEGGALPSGTRLMVSARRVGASSGAGGPGNGGMSAQVDANGRFQIERLVAGTYEISVQTGGGGMGRAGSRSGAATQTVTVGTGTVQDVTVPVNIESLQGNQNNGRSTGRSRGGRP